MRWGGAIGLVGILLVTSCSTDDGPEPGSGGGEQIAASGTRDSVREAPSTTSTVEGDEITYRIEGTAAQARVEYEYAGFGATTELTVSLPWSFTFIGDRSRIGVSAENLGETGLLRCSIRLGDYEIESDVTGDPFGTVDCQ
jgi:hypothetical protein